PRMTVNGIWISPFVVLLCQKSNPQIRFDKPKYRPHWSQSVHTNLLVRCERAVHARVCGCPTFDNLHDLNYEHVLLGRKGSRSATQLLVDIISCFYWTIGRFGAALRFFTGPSGGGPPLRHTTLILQDNFKV